MDTNIIVAQQSSFSCFFSPAIQYEALWCLANIAGGSLDHSIAVIHAGAVPILVKLLKSPSAEVVEEATRALGNIAAKGPLSRDFVLKHGVIEKLMPIVEIAGMRISLLRNIVWLMSNLCRFENPPPFDKVKQMLPAFSKMLHQSDRNILSHVCWSFSYIADSTNEDSIQAVIDTGCVPVLVSLLVCDDSSVVMAALNAVGNIVTGDDQQTNTVVAANVLPILMQLLEQEDRIIVKEAAWVVSNIACGSQQQIQEILDVNILESIVKVLYSDDLDAQHEAAWVITNITNRGTVQQTVRMIESYAIIVPFCELLLAEDPRIVISVLKGLKILFKVADFVNDLQKFCNLLESIETVTKLKTLKNYENREICRKASELIDNFFIEKRGWPKFYRIHQQRQ